MIGKLRVILWGLFVFRCGNCLLIGVDWLLFVLEWEDIGEDMVKLIVDLDVVCLLYDDDLDDRVWEFELWCVCLSWWSVLWIGGDMGKDDEVWVDFGICDVVCFFFILGCLLLLFEGCKVVWGVIV